MSSTAIDNVAAVTSLTTVELEQYRKPLLQSSLSYFIKHAWHIIEPATPLQWNWHLDVICNKLECISYLTDANRRRLFPPPANYSANVNRRIIFNIPPGTGKSLTFVFWNAWEWATSAYLRYLTASYSDDNPIRDCNKVRDIVTSSWYQQLFWNDYIDDDDNHITIRLTKAGESRLNTTQHGYRIATSIKGQGTGEHPHRIVWDDPHKADEAESLVYRNRVGTWASSTVSTRVALDPAIAGVMQRLHQDDLCGRELPKGTYDHVLLPMRYEVVDGSNDNDDNDNGNDDANINTETKTVAGKWDCPCHANGPDPLDIRTKPGELLFPSLFPESKVVLLEKDLNPFGASGQLQQRPVPISGGLIQRVNIEIIDALPLQDDIISIGRGWDTAASEKTTSNDPAWTVGTRMLLCRNGDIIIDNEVRIRVEDIDPTMSHTASLDGVKCIIREEQEPGGSGKRVIRSHEIMLAGYNYLGVSSSGSKTTKAMPFIRYCNSRRVKLLRGDFNSDWLDEVCGFPLAKFKDRIDSCAIIFSAMVLPDKRKRKRKARVIAVVS